MKVNWKVHKMLPKTLLVVIRTYFTEKFPNPEKVKKAKQGNPYALIINWFNDGYTVSTLTQSNDLNYLNSLLTVEGLGELVKSLFPKSPESEKLILMELVLHGLAEYSQLSKNQLVKGFEFKDLMSGMFKIQDDV